jgi:hypothetical protein
MIQLFRNLARLGEFVALVKAFLPFWKEVKEMLLERKLSVSNNDNTEVDTKLMSLIAKGDELHLKGQMLL